MNINQKKKEKVAAPKFRFNYSSEMEGRNLKINNFHQSHENLGWDRIQDLYKGDDC